MHRLSARRRRSPRSARRRPWRQRWRLYPCELSVRCLGRPPLYFRRQYKEEFPAPPRRVFTRPRLTTSRRAGTEQAILDVGVAPLAVAERIGLVEIQRVLRVAVEHQIFMEQHQLSDLAARRHHGQRRFQFAPGGGWPGHLGILGNRSINCNISRGGALPMPGTAPVTPQLVKGKATRSVMMPPGQTAVMTTLRRSPRPASSRPMRRGSCAGSS